VQFIVAACITNWFQNWKNCLPGLSVRVRGVDSVPLVEQVQDLLMKLNEELQAGDPHPCALEDPGADPPGYHVMACV